MKEVIILEGKNYISAKRSSGITGYTTDYIGQLCRTDKVDCRMIGHTWYVSEKSLFKHKMDSEGVGRDAKFSQSFHEDDQKFISTNEARTLSGYSSDYIGQLCRAGKLQCRRVGRAWFVTQKSIVDHKTALESKSAVVVSQVEKVASVVPYHDHTAVNPFITDGSSNIRGSLMSSMRSIHVDPKMYTDARETDIKRNRNVFSHNRRSIFVLMFVCIIIVSVGVFGRSLLSIKQIAFKIPVAPITPSGFSMLSSVGESGLNGIAVAPSTNSVAGDEALKQQIKDSFANKVHVTSDQNGTAGVITPVFKKASEGSFVYVLVPVSDAGKVMNQGYTP